MTQYSNGSDCPTTENLQQSVLAPAAAVATAPARNRPALLWSSLGTRDQSVYGLKKGNQERLDIVPKVQKGDESVGPLPVELL